MKKIFLFFMILVLFTGCYITQKKKVHYLSTLENVNIFTLNKSDSIKAYKSKLLAEKSLEECEKRPNSNCIDDIGIGNIDATFLNGISNFRMVLFNNFKVPKNAQTGENRVRVTIGTKDNLDSIEVLKSTDEYTKKAIENVFKLPKLNTWKSAKIYGIPVKEQFEISIFIENKK
ncbi:hypothetical protein GCM10022217_15190 [Chryseobacterium ginsenosidimutans]|uniref:hypothetical protein n=1 Tax=Chryseobacterium ginsenosidimutans TaxID=687846 RepID=UPI0031E21B06